MRSVYHSMILKAAALGIALLTAFAVGCVPREGKEAEAAEPADCAAVWAAYDALHESAELAGSGTEFNDRRICYECSLTVSGEEQRYYFGWDERGQVTKSLFIRRAKEGGYFHEFSFNGGEFITAPDAIGRAYAILADKAADAYLIVIQCRGTAYVYDMAGGTAEPAQEIPGRVSGYTEGLLRVRRPVDGLIYDFYSLTAGRTFSRLGLVFSTDAPGYIAEAGLTYYTRRGAGVTEDRRVFKLRALISGAFGARSAAVFIDSRTGVACIVPVFEGADGLRAAAPGLTEFDMDKLDAAELYALACPDEELIDINDWKSAVTELPREEVERDEFRFDVDGDGAEELLDKSKNGSEFGFMSKLSVNGGVAADCPHLISAIGRLELPGADGLFFVTGAGCAVDINGEVTFFYRYKDGGLELMGRLDGELYGVTESGTAILIYHAWWQEYELAACTYEPDAEAGEQFRTESVWQLADAYIRRTVSRSFEAHTAEGVITVPEGAEIELIRERPYDLPRTDATVFFTYNGTECFAVLSSGRSLDGVPWYMYFSA